MKFGLGHSLYSLQRLMGYFAQQWPNRQLLVGLAMHLAAMAANAPS